MSVQLLRNLWYYACPAAEIRPGAMKGLTLLGEPVLIGRTKPGALFAIRDLCPHRGVPLSAGRLEGGEVECPYHGWRFGPDGGCRAIPSLVPGQDFAVDRVRVRDYPVAEQDGLVWVFMSEGDARAARTVPADGPPAMPIAASAARPRLIESQLFDCDVDHAVMGLMDPAHGPFVHQAWWWRSKRSIHEKAKNFAPSPLGFTMTAHRPSSNSPAYRLLGGEVKTEISFRLPGVRIEHIRAGRHTVVGLTCCTPLDDARTEVSQIFFWDTPVLSLLKPLLAPFARAFLGQDRDMVMLQKQGLAHRPALMLIHDSDVQAMWYAKLKKAWADGGAQLAGFVNPVPETVLRWRS